MREHKNISVEEYKNVCKKLGLILEESTDPKIPGFLGIQANVYSPIFKFGKDNIADLLIQDAHQKNPWVTYCNSVEKDDNYGNINDFENLIVYIRSVGLKVKTTMKDFKKTFDNKGLVVKAIHEYESTVAQLRKTMQDNLSMAVTLVNT